MRRAEIQRRRLAYRDRRVRLQIIDTAERLEAAANSLGEIGLAIPLSADSLGQDGAEFGFHRTPVAGGADAQLLLHRWLDIADGQRAHTGYFVREYAYIIGIVNDESNACDAGTFREELRALTSRWSEGRPR